LSTFLIVLLGKNKKMDFIFLTNDLLEKPFPIVFIALRGPEPAPTPSSDICERHMLVT
jgi:hypothetical protein